MDNMQPILLDGAMGTQLQSRGLPAGVCAEIWLLEHPEAAQEVYADYAAAGSQIVIAATFRANPAALAAYQAQDRAGELNRRMVSLARASVPENVQIAGDISPTGWLCQPLGEYRFEEIVDCYRVQAAALEEAGVDCLLIETQMALSDIRAAILAVREVSQKPILVSVSVNPNGKTLYGCDAAAAMVTVQSMGVSAFGFNCSSGPETMAQQVLRVAPYARVPMIFEPNAGMPQTINGETVYDCPAEAYTEPVSALYDAGVRYFGGCCGSTPVHIAALRDALGQLEQRAFIPASEEYLASEREVFPIPEQPLKVLHCAEVEDSTDETFAIALTEASELQELQEMISELEGPLCLHCADATLLEQALRCYQGRAAYVGGGIEPEQLAALQARYGLYLLP